MNQKQQSWSYTYPSYKQQHWTVSARNELNQACTAQHKINKSKIVSISDNDIKQSKAIRRTNTKIKKKKNE